jgi:hypothetical protein
MLFRNVTLIQETCLLQYGCVEVGHLDKAVTPPIAINIQDHSSLGERKSRGIASIQGSAKKTAGAGCWLQPREVHAVIFI